jgi:hypothetical protein
VTLCTQVGHQAPVKYVIRNFYVIPDKLNVDGICTNGSYADNGRRNDIVINL